MGEILTAAHPLEAWRPAFAALAAEAPAELVVELEPDVAALDLRLGRQRSRSADTRRPRSHSVEPPSGAGMHAAADVLGRPLPTSPRAWTGLPGGQAFRLGPDEWLVTDADADPTAWEATMIEALRPHGGTATDVSAQRTGVRLRGARARALLGSGCALDLRPRVFSPGSCAQTLFGQVGVLIAAHDSGDVQLFARTSFAGYLADRLLDAAQELRPDPIRPRES